MLKIDIICVSRMKKGAYLDLIQDFSKRLQWDLNIIEVESKISNPAKCKEDETAKITKHINNTAIIIAMDERGKSIKSLAFAKILENFMRDGNNHIQFIIGGADGLSDIIRDKAQILLSFGQQTWPHLLARVMLLEQIYRAQQIIAGHPYHRE